MNVNGLQPVYCTFATDSGYWLAKPGCLYLCDCSAGDLHFKLPSVAGLVAGSDIFAAKIVGGAGTHAPYFHAWGSELISGLSVLSLPQSGQGRIFTPGAPSFTGWVSQ